MRELNPRFATLKPPAEERFSRDVEESNARLANEIAAIRAQRRFEEFGYPYGFNSRQEFESFNNALKTGFASAGYRDVTSVFQGSGASGLSFMSRLPFDKGRTSDFDIAIVSPTLFQRAQEIGVPLRGGGTRTAPLRAANLRELGLSETQSALQAQAGGRPVRFMIYRDLESAFKRPSFPLDPIE